MAFGLSIICGVIAYELHKRKNHTFAVPFDLAAILLIFFSWR